MIFEVLALIELTAIISVAVSTLNVNSDPDTLPFQLYLSALPFQPPQSTHLLHVLLLTLAAFTELYSAFYQWDCADYISIKGGLFGAALFDVVSSIRCLQLSVNNLVCSTEFQTPCDNRILTTHTLLHVLVCVWVTLIRLPIDFSPCTKAGTHIQAKTTRAQ